MSDSIDSIFNKLAMGDIMRLSYTYAIFIFVAVILVKSVFSVFSNNFIFLIFINNSLYILFTLSINIQI